MSLGMMEQVNEIRRGMAIFSEAKRIFHELGSAPVHIPDHADRKAFDEAKELLKMAAEHHVTIEHALQELLHPETAKSELERLMKQAQDHHSELGVFMDGVKGLVGAELEVVKKIIAAGEAQKLANMVK